MIARRDSSARRRGAVAVLVAICLVPLVGVLAFAIDGGLLLAARRRAQTVADASAHAAACQLYANFTSDPTGLDVSGKAKAAALAMASANGYSNDGSTNSVTVNIPPSLTLNKNFKTVPFYAEVVVTRQQPRMFSAIFGSGTIAVTTRGVARGISGQGKPYSSASIVALNSNKPNALQVTGGVNLSADSPIQVDSSSASAFSASNGVIVSAPLIQVTGNYSSSGGAILPTGKIQTNTPAIPDPLASLAAPDPTLLPAGTHVANTYTPGVYSGGLSISGNQTLAPGLYYMKGGDLNIGNGANLSGTGVTIFLDPNSKISIQGGANVSLTPPTSGQWAGMSLYEDRTSTQAISFGNGTNVNIAGTIYAANAAMNLTGGSNIHAGSQVIVGTFGLSNGINLSFTTASDAKKGYVASTTSSASITLVE